MAKPYERFISKSEILKIHEATLSVLKNTGVLFQNERALKLFKQHGFKVDGQKVYFKSHQIEKAVKSAPSQFDLQIKADKKLIIGNGHDQVIKGAGSPAFILDGDIIRKMNNQDTINQFKLATTSPVINMANTNNNFDTSRWTKDQAIWANLAISLRYSDKYNGFGIPTTYGCKAEEVYCLTRESVALVKQFEGIEAPYFTTRGISTFSPLTFDDISLAKIFALIDEKQPLLVSAAAMPLLTGAPSLSGMLVQTNAEVLAGLVLSQLAVPGLPYIYGNVSGSTNMRHIQIAFGSPESVLVAYASSGLADLYEIPFRTGGCQNDSKDIDFQSGAESMMLLYATWEIKPDIVMQTMGTLGSMNMISLEKFITDEETVMLIERIFQGIDCSNEKLCVDKINEVGPGGSFLHGRTPKMYKEDFVLNKIFNKEDANSWQDHGSESIKERAQKMVKNRLESFPIPKRTKEQLDMINKYIPLEYRDII